MNRGSIDNAKTGAGRVYAVLKRMDGEWIGGWDLTVAAGTTAVSTRVSEVRHALAADPERMETVESEQRGHGWYYRIVKTGVQLQLV